MEDQNKVDQSRKQKIMVRALEEKIKEESGDKEPEVDSDREENAKSAQENRWVVDCLSDKAQEKLKEKDAEIEELTRQLNQYRFGGILQSEVEKNKIQEQIFREGCKMYESVLRILAEGLAQRAYMEESKLPKSEPRPLQDNKDELLVAEIRDIISKTSNLRYLFDHLKESQAYKSAHWHANSIIKSCHYILENLGKYVWKEELTDMEKLDKALDDQDEDTSGKSGVNTEEGKETE